MCLNFVLCVGRIGIEGVELHTLHNGVVKQLGYDVTPVAEDVEGIYTVCRRLYQVTTISRIMCMSTKANYSTKTLCVLCILYNIAFVDS